MPSLDYDSLNTTTRKRWIPVLRDNIFDSNVLLYRLLRNAGMGGASDGGTKVIEPLEHAKLTSVGAYGKDDSLTGTTSQEIITAAEFNWKRYRATIKVDGIEELQNKGEARILDLMAARMKNASASLGDAMATDLFLGGAGANGKILEGLRAAVDDGTTVDPYGGILKSDMTLWAAQYKDKGASTLTLAFMREMWYLCAIGSDVPSLIVTTEAQLQAYEEIFMAAPRFVVPSSITPTVLEGGFQAFKFKGCPIVADSHCGCGMFFLNEKYLHFRPLMDFKAKGWQRPVDEDALVNHILWYGAFTTGNRRMSGQIDLDA